MIANHKDIPSGVISSDIVPAGTRREEGALALLTCGEVSRHSAPSTGKSALHDRAGARCPTDASVASGYHDKETLKAVSAVRLLIASF